MQSNKTIMLVVAVLTAATATSANDLIFKSGFQTEALVSGVLVGMNTGSIQLKLSSAGQDEVITVNQNGGFLFESYVAVGATWQVSIEQMPVQQQCNLANNSGTMSQAGANNVSVQCGDVESEWDVMDWDSGVWQ